MTRNGHRQGDGLALRPHHPVRGFHPRTRDPERLAALGRVTATVSHELRNPLGTIRSCSYVIAEKVRDKGLDLDRALARIDRSILRCDGIVEELLDYTRARELRREMTPIDAWLGTEVSEHRPPAGISLRFELGAGVELAIDRERFRRVVINLLDNAYQAFAEQDAEPQQPEAATVTVRSSKSRGGLEISVIDNGPGIPDHVLPKIYEPLFSTKGFGVGVPIVEQIMKQHDGELDITSEQGRGTQVALWLPL